MLRKAALRAAKSALTVLRMTIFTLPNHQLSQEGSGGARSQRAHKVPEGRYSTTRIWSVSVR